MQCEHETRFWAVSQGYFQKDTFFTWLLWHQNCNQIIFKSPTKTFSMQARNVNNRRPGIAKLTSFRIFEILPNFIAAKIVARTSLNIPLQRLLKPEITFIFFLIPLLLIAVELRLVDSLSGSANDGRVELGIGGVWKGVCSAGWDLREAMVICRMLGLPPATVAQGEAVFDNSGDTPWLGHLKCIGNESSITRCPGSELGKAIKSRCDRKTDAGVMCGNPSSA